MQMKNAYRLLLGKSRASDRISIAFAATTVSHRAPSILRYTLCKASRNGEVRLLCHISLLTRSGIALFHGRVESFSSTKSDKRISSGMKISRKLKIDVPASANLAAGPRRERRQALGRKAWKTPANSRVRALGQEGERAGKWGTI